MYISELINKVAEYRVAFVSGRVCWVANKTPGDPSSVAWNVAQGGRFDNVRWGEWPLRVVRVAREAFMLSGLDFGGVDVMTDADGQAYVLEINSAPSQTSPYRQECMAKCFDYIVTNGKGDLPITTERGGFRKFIHPALTNEAIMV
jgi:glutathione synthase/RimK-type ligase-like ATP-grasp enzyme